MADVSDEMWGLLNALCERRLTQEQAARLEKLVLTDAKARWQYLEYINLHGNLYWDAAGGMAISRMPSAVSEPPHKPFPVHKASPASRHNAAWTATAGLALTLLASVAWWNWPVGDDASGSHSVTSSTDDAAAGNPAEKIGRSGFRKPVELTPHDSVAQQDRSLSNDPIHSKQVTEDDRPPRFSDPVLPESLPQPIAQINQQIENGWAAAGVTPSEPADESAWVRRVYLDLAGHIPSADQAHAFLRDQNPRKREALVSQLLDDPAFPRQLTTCWTNLLIGRTSPSHVNRAALQKFLRTSFAANRGWDEIVTELVSAEGRSDENGATNFLIAHLNNQAVPATAITARVFLGVQVQCTQCHNHPSKLAQQANFWELNSFFHQTKTEWIVERDPTTGAAKSQVPELVSNPLGGPTFYEATNGVMKAVYPRYHGKDISSEPEFNRRKELARLMVEEDGDQLAAAFINRTWRHFFGQGFTRQVDDMGPHNPPSHPVLLEGLSAAFRQSGYDIKQLVRWICLSQPYQLSSRFHDGNRVDDPERGETALFSHVYPQPMSVEQLYDSFLVATKAHQSGATDWTAAEQQRQAFLGQFIVSFQTEENDEANTFEGTVAQALTMMNGPLMDKALEPRTGTYLGEVLRSSGGETDKIEQLCLAALSRKPTDRELTAMRDLVNKSANAPDGYQDLFWALLNSNEFSVVY